MEERAGYGKKVLFACNLVAKCRYLDLQKTQLVGQIERQNGAKYRLRSQKWTKNETCKVEKCRYFPAFWACFSLEWGGGEGVVCK